MKFRSISTSLIAALAAFWTVLAAPAVSANPEAALQAEAMLSPGQWALAVRIENTNSVSRYPETVYGTVFEFRNLLWFYTKTGTQPLRASENRTDEFKDDLLPLLRTMEPGFRSFAAISVEQPFGGEFAPLINGCVIESIFSFNERQVQGEPILEAKMLLYTSKNATRVPGATRPTGHAVLVYKTPSGTFFVDPPKIEATGQLAKHVDWDPMKMAAEIESHYGENEIENAFFEPFDLSVSTFASLE